MNLRKIHLDYWRQRTSNPSWVSLIKRNPMSSERRISIDEIVNANADVRPNVDAINTLSLLRLARKNGELLNSMWSCANGPFRHQHKRRAAWCAKWLQRLGHEIVERP